MSEGPGRRRALIGAGVGLAVVVVAVLAFGVFGVQTLFIDDEVDEAGPTFRSGASADEPTAATTTSEPSGPREGTDPAPDAPTTEPTPVVEEVARGSFEAGDHPGEGTAVILSDGQQSFVRFEDDFSTDNGPDLFAVAYADGERVELERLKGNKGAQNYELPADIEPGSVTAVAVWCKRFDSTFTTADLT